MAMGTPNPADADTAFQAAPVVEVPGVCVISILTTHYQIDTLAKAYANVPWPCRENSVTHTMRSVCQTAL